MLRRSGGKRSVTSYSINDKRVCRTAPPTQVLLIMYRQCKLKVWKISEMMGRVRVHMEGLSPTGFPFLFDIMIIEN